MLAVWPLSLFAYRKKQKQKKKRRTGDLLWHSFDAPLPVSALRGAFEVIGKSMLHWKKGGGGTFRYSPPLQICLFGHEGNGKHASGIPRLQRLEDLVEGESRRKASRWDPGRGFSPCRMSGAGVTAGAVGLPNCVLWLSCL